MIHAQQLSRRYGRVLAVDGIDFTIPRGRVVAFLGPNGAGKTTTIRMIAGSLRPTAGSVTVDGLDVRRHPREVRRLIGYLPEAAPLYTEMRVTEYLRFRARLWGVERRRRKRAIDRVIHRCWLEDVRRRPIGHLSKGYRQRVGLAAALLHRPPVLILDEPTVGLDPAQIREVRALLRELAGRHTILLSTHILPEAELACDDIIVIASGKVRAQGTVQELRAKASEHGRYVMECDLPDAAQVLRPVAGVKDIETVRLDDRWSRLLVEPKRDAEELREALARAVHGAGATVRELRRDAATLEQLFMELVIRPPETGKPRDAAKQDAGGQGGAES